MEQFMIYQYPASTIYSTSTAPDQKDYLQMINVTKSSLQDRFKPNTQHQGKERKINKNATKILQRVLMEWRIWAHKPH